MKRILEAYDESVFNISQNFIRVIFMFDKEMINDGNNEGKNDGNNEGKYDGVKEFKLSSNQKKILKEMKKNNIITQKELAILLNISESTIQRNTVILQEQGFLKRIGPRFGGHWEVVK